MNNMPMYERLRALSEMMMNTSLALSRVNDKEMMACEHAIDLRSMAFIVEKWSNELEQEKL